MPNTADISQILGCFTSFFCDHHDLIPQDEYNYICQKLFDLGLHNTARCIIALDTQAGGRINEAKLFDKRDIGKHNNNLCY